MKTIDIEPPTEKKKKKKKKKELLVVNKNRPCVSKGVVDILPSLGEELGESRRKQSVALLALLL